MQRFRTHLALLSLPLVAACSQPPAPSDGATPADAAASMDATTGADGALSMDGNGASAIESAYATGAVGAATEQEVCAALRADLAATRTARFAIWSALYGTGPTGESIAGTINDFSWNPTHDSMVLTSLDDGRNVPVIVANAQQAMGTPARSPLAIAGTVGAWRYLALGTNGPSNFGNTAPAAGSAEARMEQVFVRAIRWLTGNNAADGAGLKVVTAHLADSFYFRHDRGTRGFFTRHFSAAQLNADDTCESAGLEGCLDGASLLVIGADDGTGDDNSRVPLDVAAIDRALTLARSRGIPVLYAPHYREENAMNARVHRALRVTVSNNYWDIQRLDGASTAELTGRALPVDAVARAVETVCDGTLTAADFEPCTPNPDARATTLDSCAAPMFRSKLMDGATIVRQSVEAMDASGTNPFATDGYRIVRGAILLGDLLRSGPSPLRYPIPWNTTPAQLARAAFSDSSMHLAHGTNRAIADMGTYACTRESVLSAPCRPYDPAMIPTAASTVSTAFLQGDEWTSTGRYALAGRPFRLRRTDVVAGRVFARVGFARLGTTRAFEMASGSTAYSRPQRLVSAWIELEKDREIELSSPLGGPIYLRTIGSDAARGMLATVETTGTGAHAALLEATPQAAANFVNEVRANPLPHVDARLTGFEIHLRRDRFLRTVTGSTEIARRASGPFTVAYNSDVNLAIDHIQNHFVGSVYGLAGFAAPGSTLEATLSSDVKAVCQTLGWACTDASVHRRSTIQHANYDENANCGSGCSGNPFDADWSIIPLGWGESHELGHNLQIKQLNVHYTSAADRANWARWSNRAGENSNNIFPYHTLWRFIRRAQSDSTVVTDGHMNFKTLFAASQSSRAALVSTVMGAQRRVIFDERCNVLADGATSEADLLPEAIWGDPAYAADNGLRMAFYVGLAVRLHGATVQGRALADGWDIFPLLYAHARLFSQAARAEASWTAARASLGFDRFAFSGDAQYGGGNVSTMPGNDFLLVSLSWITGRDVRPYFREHGVRFSDRANEQVQAMVTAGRASATLGGTALVLETDLAPSDMSAVARVALDGTAAWPRDGWHPSRCVR
jgi:hypothetical protein